VDNLWKTSIFDDPAVNKGTLIDFLIEKPRIL